jgi:arsenical pump membrane protein
VSDPPALLLAAVLLVGTLAAAAVDSPRLPPALLAVPGALLVVLLGAVSWTDAVDTTRQVAPTVAFLVVVLLLAELADREGLFTWSAALTARQAGSSAAGLLVRVTLLATVVTAVLSLDATVVLLTPVVVATALRRRVPVRPHGYAVGHLANSASLLLPVSNLTNLLAVAATGLSFVHFAGLMVLPQLVTVLLEYAVLRWLFREDLRRRVDAPVHDVPGTPVLALVVVGATVVGFGVASLAGLPPVWPAAGGSPSWACASWPPGGRRCASSWSRPTCRSGSSCSGSRSWCSRCSSTVWKRCCTTCSRTGRGCWPCSRSPASPRCWPTW